MAAAASACVLTAAVASGCLSPRKDYDDYLDRTETVRGQAPPSGGAGGDTGAGGSDTGPVCTELEGCPFDKLSGDYLGSCVTEVSSFDPKLPLRFKSKITFDRKEDGTGTVTIEMTPLLIEAKTLGETVGDKIVAMGFTVDDKCNLNGSLGTVKVTGKANKVSGSNIEVINALLTGFLTSNDRLCGELDGTLKKPFDYDLVTSKGDICTFVKCEGGDSCMLRELGKQDYVCKAPVISKSGCAGAGGAGAGGEGQGGEGGEAQGGEGGAAQGGAAQGGAAQGGSSGGGAGGSTAGAAGSAGEGGAGGASGGAGGTSGSGGAGGVVIPPGPWACLGISVPTAAQGPTIDLTVHVVDGITENPVVGATVKACAFDDADCATPLGSGVGTSDAEGKVSMTGLPTAAEGFTGYFEVSADKYKNTIRFPSYPLTKSGATVQATIAGAAIYDALVGGLLNPETVDPARGNISMAAVTCEGKPEAPGITVSVDVGDDKTRYAYGGKTPVKTNTATTADGGASRMFAFNVPPGVAIVTGTHTTEGNKKIGDFKVRVRAGWVTSVQLDPIPPQ